MTRAELKSRFQSVDKPDGADFAALIDALFDAGAEAAATADIAAAQLDGGTALQFPRVPLSGGDTQWTDSGSVDRLITQTSHGLNAGDIVYLSTSGLYARAVANVNREMAQVAGVVKSAVANSFVLTTAGKLELTPTSGNIGEIFYLSSTNAGGYVPFAGRPNTAGQFVSPVFQRTKVNEIQVIIQPAVEIAGMSATGDSSNTSNPAALLKAWVNFNGKPAAAPDGGLPASLSFNQTAIASPTKQVVVIGTLPATVFPAVLLLSSETGDFPATLSEGTLYWLRPVVGNKVEFYTTESKALAAYATNNNSDAITVSANGTATYELRRSSLLNDGLPLNVVHVWDKTPSSIQQPNVYRVHFRQDTFTNTSYVVSMGTSRPTQAGRTNRAPQFVIATAAKDFVELNVGTPKVDNAGDVNAMHLLRADCTSVTFMFAGN